jgi:hypothetical protein
MWFLKIKASAVKSDPDFLPRAQGYDNHAFKTTENTENAEKTVSGFISSSFAFRGLNKGIQSSRGRNWEFLD